MSYYIAPSLLALTNEVNKKYSPPNWPTVSAGDGAIGDTSHQARKSDHNPDYSSGGVVRAVDIGIRGRDAKAILNEVVGDVRVEYVIFNRKIYSRNYGWRARAYNGSNPHTTHIHVSIRHSRKYENNTSLWFEKKVRTRPVIDYSNLRHQFLVALDLRDGELSPIFAVKVIQRQLNRQYKAGLKVDGYVGKATLDAWAKHERTFGISGRPRVPDLETVQALATNFKFRK